MWQFKITGRPISSKNSRPVFINKATGKPFTGKSRRLREYTEAAMWEFKAQSAGHRKHFPLTDRIEVEFLFYVPDKRKRDLVNLIQLPCDLLEKSGIIENDNLIVSLDGSRIFLDRDNPRTEITIRRV